VSLVLMASPFLRPRVLALWQPPSPRNLAPGEVFGTSMAPHSRDDLFSPPPLVFVMTVGGPWGRCFNPHAVFPLLSNFFHTPPPFAVVVTILVNPFWSFEGGRVPNLPPNERA